MSFASRGPLKSWIKRFRNTPIEPSSEVTQESWYEPATLANPVDAYYLHKAHKNLRVLYRFAIQTRSLAIRDVFAKASSRENLYLVDLLRLIDNNLPQELSEGSQRSLESLFDSSVLIVLADLLANTARNDLDTHAAVRIYDFVYALYGRVAFSDQQVLLYVEALNEVGNYAKAEQLAREHSVSDIAPLQPELLNIQRFRRTSPSIDEWVRMLNSLYIELDLTRVRLLEDESVSPIDRLSAAEGQPIKGPKVSVIMPTFSPGPSIRTAIRGLLEQRWQNLEIIIVDDASPQEYQEVFQEIAGLDSRIRVLHQKENAGAYVARNAGLAVATGEYITTTDDDDWSHPDKIALQVSTLLDDPDMIATISAHIRTTENLEFRRVNSSAKFLQMNYSSLMFRKRVVEEIGCWDTVNRGADSEFYTRVMEYYGADRVAQNLDKPLAFSRVWAGSLTSGEMYRSFIGTPRVLYLWAIRQWRWDLGKIDQKPTRSVDGPRPYAVPTTFEAGQRNKDLGLFDVIYVTDFFRQAKHVDYVLGEVETLHDRGLRIGYIHLDSPRTTSPAGFPQRLFRLQLEGKLTQISLQDTAETKLLVVYDAAVGMFADQTRANTISHHSILVERELPTLSGAVERVPTDYRQALRNLDSAFNGRFNIVGATDQDQARVAALVSETRLLPESSIWRTHVRAQVSEIKFPDRKPIVGFHSYGNKYRWPNNDSVFRRVYLSDAHETRFSGQLEPAVAKFGEEAFATSQIVDFHETSTRDFLAGIDFWIYYPHPKLQDGVWEPVLSAMNSGKVVILPPRLERVYGDAAVYGEPDEIEGIVTHLAESTYDYEEQARLGQSLVDSAFSTERLYERVIKHIREPNNR